MNFFVKLLHHNARPPRRAEPGSAGYDLFAPNKVIIPAGRQVKVNLGFAASFDPGYVALIFDRSSLGILGVGRLAGVIDSSYRGEWAVVLRNFSQYVYSSVGAVAQVVFVRHESPDVVVVDRLDETIRGAGGFGSTNAGI